MTISIAKYASVKVLSQEMCSTESSTTMMMLVEISVMMTASKTRLGPNLERRPYFDARTERTSQQYPRSVFPSSLMSKNDAGPAAGGRGVCKPYDDTTPLAPRSGTRSMASPRRREEWLGG